MRPKLSTLFLLTALVAFTVAPLRASDPVGCYGVIEKVVFEPNDTEPSTVQIWGTFSFAVPRTAAGQPQPAGSFGTAANGNVYAAVQKGYRYYTCAKGKDAACQAEWMDLKSVAGKREVVGFGTRWAMSGRLRAATEKPGTADVYPLNVGVTKMGSLQNRAQYADLIAALEMGLKGK